MPRCLQCPSVCVGGKHQGRYCVTELDLVYDEFGGYAGSHPHPAGDGRLNAADVDRVGGALFTITAEACRASGGVCNATTTMMAGAAHPLECERLWGPVPLSSETGEPLPPATAAEPCSDEGCGPAYMQVCFCPECVLVLSVVTND